MYTLFEKNKRLSQQVLINPPDVSVPFIEAPGGFGSAGQAPDEPKQMAKADSGCFRFVTQHIR